MSSSKADHSQGLLLFRLHNQQTFALGTLKIQELVPFQPVTPMVNQHASILVALTIRGQTMPIVDLAAAVGKSDGCFGDLSFTGQAFFEFQGFIFPGCNGL